MNIFIQEMKMSFRSRLFWLIGLLAVMIFFMSLFPSFKEQVGLFEGIIAKFPKAFVDALGMANMDFGSVLGFYGFTFSYIMLIAGIFSMKTGMGIVSEEIRIRAADFLIAKPVSRFSIMLWKGLSILANITILVLVYSVVAYLMCNSMAEGGIDNGTFLALSLGFYLICLFFMAFGMMLGAFFKRVRAVLPTVMGVVFGFFAIRFLSTTFPDAHLDYFTPFCYFDVEKILTSGGMDTEHLLLSVLLTIVFIGLAFYQYIRKDMPTV